MNMKNLKLTMVFALLAITNLGYSQGMAAKLLAKAAKKLGTVNVTTTASLDSLVLTAAIASNLHPAELGTISQTFFTGWKPGGDQVVLMFSKENAPGTLKIDGTVSIDGMPMEYLTMGNYSIITDPSTAPRKIEIATSSGQKSSFNMKPHPKKFKVLSINGQKENVTLDLTKDVVIELEGVPASENALYKVSIAINQVSIKSIYDVCFIRSGSTITIPAAAFRNMNIVPGGDAVYSYKGSFLSVGVESMEKATDVSGNIKDVSYICYYNDGLMMTVSNEPNLNKGLLVKETDNDLEMEYIFFKPNAFMSRPFEHIKKIGLISFSVRGTTYKEYSETTTSNRVTFVGGQKATEQVTTTSTTKLEFPQQPNEMWDALLEKLYPEFMGVIKSEFGCADVPVDKVTGSQAYKNTVSFAKDDENTKVAFARSYRGTKVLSAFMPVSEGFGTNGINQKIMDEVGADALLTMTLDLEVSETKEGKLLMMPKFAFEIVGKTNGYLFNTKYCTGNIKGLSGAVFTKDINPEQLEDIVRKSDLLSAFRKGLQGLKAQEQANGDYATIWNLQK